MQFPHYTKFENKSCHLVRALFTFKLAVVWEFFDRIFMILMKNNLCSTLRKTQTGQFDCSLPVAGRDKIRAPLKTPAGEANFSVFLVFVGTTKLLHLCLNVVF